jgi:hypothetical protein
MRNQRAVRGLVPISVLVFILQGCQTSEGDGEGAINFEAASELEVDIQLQGSVGDGPISSANLTIYSKDNEVLSNAVSDQFAGYNTQLKTKGKYYPLLIEAEGGIDLITQLPPDFIMVSAATEPRKSAVANINPFSTLTIAIARQQPGGLTTQNISRALGTVTSQFNLGMTSQLSRDPISTRIDDANLAEIVKSSEALAEVFRRTLTSVRASRGGVSIDAVIDAIAADLTDGVVDGRGGQNVDRHISAATQLVSSQVAMELITNELRVHGVVVTSLLDDVIVDLATDTSVALTDSRPVNSYLIAQARRGVDAAIALGGGASLESLRTALGELRAGMTAAAAETALPTGAASSLDGAIGQIGAAATSDINRVFGGATPLPPSEPEPQPQPEPEPEPEPEPQPQPEPEPEPEPQPQPQPEPEPEPEPQPQPQPEPEPEPEPRPRPQPEPEPEPEPQPQPQPEPEPQPQPEPEPEPEPQPQPEPEPVNTAPEISGTPSAEVLQETEFRFLPSADDADDDLLIFSIANRPPWAEFNIATGELSGRPSAADIGTYGNIRISVSDGEDSATLPAFSVTVQAIALGSATLMWTPPTTNTDGSPLTDLAGYRVHWGQQSGSYTESVSVMNPGITTYVVENLTSGTYYFVTTAITAGGLESSFSNEASKTIP